MSTIDSALRIFLAAILIALMAWALLTSRAEQRRRRWPVRVLFILLVLYTTLFFWAMARRAGEFERSTAPSAAVGK